MKSYVRSLAIGVLSALLANCAVHDSFIASPVLNAGPGEDPGLDPSERNIDFQRVCAVVDRPYYDELENPEIRYYLATFEQSGGPIPAGLRWRRYQGYQSQSLLLAHSMPKGRLAKNHKQNIPAGVLSQIPANAPDNQVLVVDICEASAPKVIGGVSAAPALGAVADAKPESSTGGGRLARSNLCLGEYGNEFLAKSVKESQDPLSMYIYHSQITWDKVSAGIPPEQCDSWHGSPLVLDLDNDGIELVGLDAGVRFDVSGEGKKLATGWIGSGRDAFLAFDLNRNGIIDSGRELFGDATLLPDGSEAANGFEALKQYDSNADGLFSAQDKAFPALQLWLDHNGNGLSEKGELVSLDSESVAEIRLDYIQQFEEDRYGNRTLQRSLFTKKGQPWSVFRIVDIWFSLSN